MNGVMIAVVAAAGALGALARYALDAAVSHRAGGPFPWGTFAVNASGSLLLGALAGLAASAGLPAELKLAAGGGFLGAFTTFSTWMVQSVELAELGHRRAAVLNLAGSAASGPLLAGLGFSVAAAIA